MRHHPVPQGSAEWFKVRAGIPTASEFDKILTPKTLKLSASAEPYMHRLLAEWMTGEVFEQDTTVWMTQGVTMEEMAAEYYELTTGREVKECGLCTTDDGKVGASPDRFVGDVGLLEIKYPMASTHVGYLLKGDVPSEYILQVQGQLYVTQKPWLDFLSYHVGLPSLLVRVLPDPIYQDALANALSEFNARMEHYKVRLQAMREG